MKFLMCYPEFFNVEYHRNVWMKENAMVDRDRAKRQYGRLKKTYEDLGVEIAEIEPVKGLPDMVYAANCGFLNGKDFVKSNYYNKERRKEADLASQYFRKRGYNVITLPEHLYFEGQGDLVKCGGKFFCGYGFRTNFKTIKHLEEILGAKVFPLKLVDPRWYHLDTCFFTLRDGAAFIEPEAFSKDSLALIYLELNKVIETKDPEDIESFACNSVVVGDKVVTNKMSAGSKKALADAGFEVIEVDVSEFLKGGGSVRCLTFDL